MSTTRSAARRSTLSVAALFGAAALLFGGVAPSVATTSEASQIDTGRTGSITIHKYEQPREAGAAHDGTYLGENLPVGLNPLNGVEFTVSQVQDINLGTSAGWQEVERLKDKPIKDAIEETKNRRASPHTITTGGDGSAAASGLPLGLYLVEEQEPTSGSNIVAPVTPFLVTLPLAGPDNTWLYDVHAYPKNAVASLTMKADESSALGMNGTGTINWEIATTIPHMPADQPLTSYALVLDLRDNLRAASDILGTGSGIGAEDVTVSVEGYQAHPDEYDVDLRDGILTVTPRADLRAYLNGLGGQEVRLTVKTKMTANDDQEGVVTARATVQVNGRDTAAAEASSAWGAVRVIATSGSGVNGRPLSGVEYKLSTTPEGSAIEVEGERSFSTNEQGELMIAGVQVDKTYYLIETETPAGYTAAEAQSFTVKAADIQTVGGNDSHTNVIKVEKAQISGFALPITGSFGSLPFILAGLLLVATALIVNRQRRRRLAQAV